tara:strand:- start:383 stop:757 length:375 start_codon:yes stop_codon:yes gene_type:complete
MNFNQNVDQDFVDAILESSHWQKAKINVVKRTNVNESSENESEIGTVPEYEAGVANEYEEPHGLEQAEEDLTFDLNDLQVVLDNLDDESLMEHALSMLDVFDEAYEQLNEGGEGCEEDEEDEEE